MKSPQVELKRKIPVVYMYCGSNMNETKKKAKKLNIEYFVEKPIQKNNLKRALIEIGILDEN